MKNDVLTIRWDAFREGDLDSFHDMLIEIHDREYTLEHMIQILKMTPKYLVVEAINWNFDTVTRDNLYTCLSDQAFRGLIEDPDWVKKTTNVPSSN